VDIALYNPRIATAWAKIAQSFKLMLSNVYFQYFEFTVERSGYAL